MALDLYLPQGRFVFGNLYKGNTTDRAGRPLMTSKNTPRTDYVLGYAIAKIAGIDWRQTEWGQQFVAQAMAGFPGGQHQLPTFAWKVIDGDSTVPNQNMKRPVDMAGHPGHWVLRLKSGFACMTAHINPATGRPEQLLQPDAIVPGDYIQAHVNVAPNMDLQKPGIYLNPNVVCLMSKGERIVSGPDVGSMAFGAAAAAPTAAAPAPVAQVAPPPVPGVPVVPNPAFLQVPFPPPGWTAHPTAPGYFYKGQEVLTEADLRARGAAA